MSSTGQLGTAVGGDGTSRPPEREPFWDNARWLAILLVVVGHTTEKQSDSDVMAALYVSIYAFHMPLVQPAGDGTERTGARRP